MKSFGMRDESLEIDRKTSSVLLIICGETVHDTDPRLFVRRFASDSDNQRGHQASSDPEQGLKGWNFWLKYWGPGTNEPKYLLRTVPSGNQDDAIRRFLSLGVGRGQTKHNIWMVVMGNKPKYVDKTKYSVREVKMV